MKEILPLILIAFLLLNCTQSKREEGNTDLHKRQYTEEKNPVEVIILNESTFKKEMVSTGKLNAPRKGNLKFRTNGIANKLFVKNGQLISIGDTIATLDNFEQSLHPSKNLADV